MDIKIDKYTLMSDGLSIWILEECPYKNKEGEDSTKQEKVAGYSPTFTSLLTSFVASKMKQSNAKEMKKYLTELAQIENNLLEIASTLGSELKKYKKVVRTK